MKLFQMKEMFHNFLLVGVDLMRLSILFLQFSKHIYIMAAKSRWQAVFVQSTEIQGKANPQIYFSSNGRFTTSVD